MFVILISVLFVCRGDESIQSSIKSGVLSVTGSKVRLAPVIFFFFFFCSHDYASPAGGGDCVIAGGRLMALIRDVLRPWAAAVASVGHQYLRAREASRQLFECRVGTAHDAASRGRRRSSTRMVPADSVSTTSPTSPRAAVFGEGCNRGRSRPPSRGSPDAVRHR